MMEIVIKIPDRQYELLQRVAKTERGLENLSEFGEFIINGTPLPKGHGRLKDVDHYIKMQWEHPDYSLMDDEPTIIEAESEEQT